MDALRGFPQSVRRDAGFQLDKVQHGKEPDDWKPMTAIGSGVKEIRIRDEVGAFRVVYLRSTSSIAFRRKRRKPASRT